MLTRKNFVEFAKIAGAEKDPVVRQKLIDAFIRASKASNPRFDTQKFNDFVSKLVERM